MRNEYDFEEIEEDEDAEEDDIEDDSDQAEEINKMMSYYQNEFKSRGQGYSNRLPKCFTLLLGEANRLYLEKNFESAMEVCYEAIKMYPENPEPYHLLSVSGLS